MFIVHIFLVQVELRLGPFSLASEKQMQGIVLPILKFPCKLITKRLNTSNKTFPSLEMQCALVSKMYHVSFL